MTDRFCRPPVAIPRNRLATEGIGFPFFFFYTRARTRARRRCVSNTEKRKERELRSVGARGGGRVTARAFLCWLVAEWRDALRRTGVEATE